MKKLTLLKSLLLTILLVGSVNVFGQTYLLQEDFSSITKGDNTTTGGSSTAWNGNDNFPTVSSAYQAGGAVRLGTASLTGSITSKTLDLSVNGGNFSVSFDVKGWTTVEGNITVTVTGLTAQTVTYTAKMADNFENHVLNFTGGTANSTVTIATTAKRAFIDNVKVYYTSANPVAATPTFSPEPGTYTSAQSVTISCTTPGATIYYTTDGSTPDNTKTQYTGAISVTATTTIKAIAYAAGYDPSAVASATYTINAVPTITVTEVTIPAFSATAGSSQDQTITVNGTNLTGDITLALSGTDKAMFELSEDKITPASGTVTDKVITITYVPTALGTHTATLTLSSPGATDVTRDLTGTASLAQPTVTGASNIGKTGLTLNWNAVTGATEYKVNVYTKTGSAEMTDKESFDGITPDETGKLIQSATYTTGWSASSQSTTRQIYTTTGNYGAASPSFALTTTDDFIQTNTYASPITNFSFWAKQQGGTTSSTLIEGYNGTSWVTIATLSNADVSTTSGETKTYNLTALGLNNIIQIKMTFTKVTNGGNLSVDDVTVTYGGATITPITGSPFTVSETSLQITGLTPATTYYYTVTAKNGSYVSSASDEASASTLGTATPNVSVQGIFVRNGKVIVTASAAGQRIEVYNTLGQRLVNVVSKEGENEISVPSKGIFMVKCGTEINKIILP